MRRIRKLLVGNEEGAIAPAHLLTAPCAGDAQVLGELAAVRGLLPLQAQGSLASSTRSRSSSLGAPRAAARARPVRGADRSLVAQVHTQGYTQPHEYRRKRYRGNAS